MSALTIQTKPLQRHHEHLSLTCKLLGFISALVRRTPTVLFELAHARACHLTTSPQTALSHCCCFSWGRGSALSDSLGCRLSSCSLFTEFTPW